MNIEQDPAGFYELPPEKLTKITPQEIQVGDIIRVHPNTRVGENFHWYYMFVTQKGFNPSGIKATWRNGRQGGDSGCYLYKNDDHPLEKVNPAEVPAMVKFYRMEVYDEFRKLVETAQ